MSDKTDLLPWFFVLTKFFKDYPDIAMAYTVLAEPQGKLLT